MKTSLFNDLMVLFEQQYGNLSAPENSFAPSTLMDNLEQMDNKDNPVLLIKEARAESTRVFTADERMRFTKASHQFLVRLSMLGIFSVDYVEMVINNLLLSNTKVISLGETKWFIRDFIRNELDSHQLAFLDLVLYQKEDQISIH